MEGQQGAAEGDDGAGGLWGAPAELGGSETVVCAHRMLSGRWLVE